MKLFFHFLNGLCLPHSKKNKRYRVFLLLFVPILPPPFHLASDEGVCVYVMMHWLQQTGKKRRCSLPFPARATSQKDTRKSNRISGLPYTHGHSPLNFPPLFSCNQVKKRVLSTLLFSPFLLFFLNLTGRKVKR